MEKVALILVSGISNVPVWATSGTTIGELLTTAAQTPGGTQRGPNINHILNDPIYRQLLSQEVFMSGLLDGNVLNIFNPGRFVVVIISHAGYVHHFRMASSATVRDVKQRIKRRLPFELRKSRIFELLITGSHERPEGKVILSALTQPPYRNVCFDLVPRSGSRIRVRKLFSVNEGIFRQHLQQSRFQAGVDKGLWRLVSISWPNAVIAVSTAGRGAREYFVRFRLDDYPMKPPCVELWDEQHQRTVPPNCWLAWFTHFVAESYPELITVDPTPYTTAALKISVLIATRRRRICREAWNPSGDITQCLAAIINHLLYRERLVGKDRDVRQRRIRALVPHQQSA